VVRLDRAWLRFAPFTGSGLVIAAAGIGALTQLLQTVGLFDRLDPTSVSAPPLPVVVLVPLGILLALVLVTVLSVAGYLVTNWDFRLVRTRSLGGASWHLTRGLFTTRETTIDHDRLAGVTLSEPLGLRAARGARLAAIVTGLDHGQQGGSALVPPAPRAVVFGVAESVLGTPGPVITTLESHGSRATRRRWVRALVPACAVPALAVLGVVLEASPWWLVAFLVLPVAAALAADRARSLGHALVEGYVVSRSGSLTRQRRVLAVEHVIGWNFSATWFQRRAGLCTLVATTAGGSQAVPVLDVPEHEAVRLAERALPDLAEQFRRREVGPEHDL
jgi:putative membrane protein